MEKKLILFLIIILITSISQLHGQDTTRCSLIKQFEIHNKPIKNPVKITYDNQMIFTLDAMSFLKFSSKQLSIFEKYMELFKRDLSYKRNYNKVYNDTLYVELNHLTDTSDYSQSSYSLDIRLQTFNDAYFTSLSENDSIGSIDDPRRLSQLKKFYNATKSHVANELMKKKRAQAYSIKNQRHVHSSFPALLNVSDLTIPTSGAYHSLEELLMVIPIVVNS